ncbi:MAG: ABC transporter ATP-binding protein [Alkalilacustris sp.]
MFDFGIWRKAWSILTPRERRNALLVLGVAILGAASSTLMVGSIMPFLAVLSDPGRIQSTPMLAWAYGTLGFQSTYGFLVGLGIAALAVIFLGMAMQVLKVYVVARFATQRVHSISHRLMARFLGQPYEFFLDRHSGDMGTRVLAEASEVVGRCLRPAADLVTAALTIMALLAFLLWVAPLISLVAFGVLGGSYAVIYAYIRVRMRKLGAERAAANAERYRMAAEALGGVKDIKVLGREAAYVDRFAVPSRRMADVQVSIQMFGQLPQVVIQSVASGGIIVLCLVLVGTSDLDSGSALATLVPLLGLFAFAGQRLMPELGRLYGALAMMQSGRAVVDLVHAELVRGDGRPLSRKRSGALGLRRELRLDGVSYRYPNAQKPGLDDISLSIAAGERVGIVGSTGAGKTTLADIVLGLLRPQAGQIVVDGTVVDDSRLRAWQETVGYVPQDIFLTDASISENIALGVATADIDDARVQRAARIASLDGFVREQLADGYATTVGERGVRLSGGQRQRIGIARAMYHDADLIVFDEATSALDNLTERDVMAAINALPGDKTILMIAHRLSTVRVCDRIVVLDRGRLAAVGSWDELMRTSPEFRRIAELAEVA